MVGSRDGEGVGQATPDFLQQPLVGRRPARVIVAVVEAEDVGPVAGRVESRAIGGDHPVLLQDRDRQSAGVVDAVLEGPPRRQRLGEHRVEIADHVAGAAARPLGTRAFVDDHPRHRLLVAACEEGAVGLEALEHDGGDVADQGVGIRGALDGHVHRVECLEQPHVGAAGAFGDALLGDVLHRAEDAHRRSGFVADHVRDGAKVHVPPVVAAHAAFHLHLIATARGGVVDGPPRGGGVVGMDAFGETGERRRCQSDVGQQLAAARRQRHGGRTEVVSEGADPGQPLRLVEFLRESAQGAFRAPLARDVDHHAAQHAGAVVLGEDGRFAHPDHRAIGGDHAVVEHVIAPGVERLTPRGERGVAVVGMQMRRPEARAQPRCGGQAEQRVGAVAHRQKRARDRIGDPDDGSEGGAQRLGF